MTLYKEKIVFSDNFLFLEHNDEFVVINGATGMWGIVEKSVFEKIQSYVVNNIKLEEYLQSYVCEAERDSFREILEVFLSEGLLSEDKVKNFQVKTDDIEFKVTNRCNLYCKHCGQSSHFNAEETLNTADIKYIIDKISKLEAETLLITGGEPLMRKDIKELLPYIKEKFTGSIDMITNGTLIDKETAELLRKCLHSISISIDGYDKKSCEFIRGTGVYEKIMTAIKLLKEVGFTKDTLILTMVATVQNYRNIDDFYKLCEELEVTGAVRKLSPLGRGLENYGLLGLKENFEEDYNDTETIEAAREELKCRVYCKAGVKKFMIDQNGDLYPCLVVDKKEYCFGNILNEEIFNIFKSEEYREFLLNKVRKPIVNTQTKCNCCNVRYFCMDKCLGINNTYYDKKEILEEKCTRMKPYLNRIIWNE
jgi:radical SAM protein with 4Fe4S-binding SPASM domain